MAEKMHVWQGIASDAGSSTDRMSVPGGWIYREVRWDRYAAEGDTCPVSTALVFVSSPADERA